MNRSVNQALLLTALFCAVLLPKPLPAQPFPERDLPPILRPWVPWVLDEHRDAPCPVIGDSFSCLWPGALDLSLSNDGGSFSFSVSTDRTLFVPLPGDTKIWPQRVTVDGKAAPVVVRGQTPSIYLPAGTYRIEGRFAWKTLPDSLAVPEKAAIVTLSVSGRVIPNPRREENGLLLLKDTGESETSGDNLRLKVFRKLADGIPLFMETRVQFEVSGKAREVRLSGVRLQGGIPVSVSGDLPARLDADILLVQVRSGRFWVSVRERLEGQPSKLRPGPSEEPWPQEEVWSFQPNEDFRQVEVSGALPIDPVRSEVPVDWQKLAAYQLNKETDLVLKEMRRGKPEASPDQLALSRAMWLDLDGKNISIRDSFSGSLGRTSRLSLLEPAALGRASLDNQDQLITLDPVSKLPGVEVRKVAVQLEADSRMQRGGPFPASGWNINPQSLSISLNLPPGWTLLAAPGVDQVPGAWINQWNLFGFFAVLLIAISAAKLLDPKWGGVALLTLVVCHAEAGAPQLVWLSLLGALALLGLVPPGKLRTAVQIWWWISLLVFAVIVIPFAIHEIRTGLFPQVAHISGGSLPGGSIPLLLPMAKEAAAPGEEIPQAPPEQERDETAKQISVSSNSQLRMQSYVKKKGWTPQNAEAYQQDPHSIIQTGSGVPNWTWRTESLRFSGPVSQEHTIRLLLLSPSLNLLLAILRVLLVAALAGRLLADTRSTGLVKKGLFTSRVLATAVLVLLITPARITVAENQPEQQAAPPLPPSPAVPVPGPNLLEELAARITRPPECVPECVSTADTVLTLSGGILTIDAEVHAAVIAGWPLPGPASSWVPSRVSLDGKPATAIVRGTDGFLHARIPEGVHRILLEGPLPARDSLVLQFAAKPRRITGSAHGWQIDGIREDGTTEGSVQLTRRLDEPGAGKLEGGGLYEPWLEVVRVFDIGVNWTSQTTVRRISPAGAPILAKVPLLAGMLVTDGDRSVKDGEIEVSLGRDTMETSWLSSITIAPGTPLILKAVEGRPYSEVWILRCGTVWQCDVKGAVPPVQHQADGYLAREYRPWPGESLELTFKKPAGAPGQALTIDMATLNLRPGVRLLDATLSLSVRSSRAGPLTLTLPKGIDVQSVKTGGSERPVRPEGDKLSVSVGPGSQNIEVNWRQEGGLRLFYTAPRVILGSPAVNANVEVQLPPNRWVLLARGPKWGPAILFWGYLFFVSIAALLLGKLKLSPLKSHEWFILGLGLAQLPAPILLVVAGWFLFLAWRRESTDLGKFVFDFRQIVAVIWTLVFLFCLYGAIHQGLLLRPDMQVEGNGSSDSLLRWYVDRTAGEIGGAWVLSTPMWFYRVLMLLWALWLASRLLRWLGWAWESFNTGGSWKRLRKERVIPQPPPLPPPPPSPLTTSE